MCIYSQYMFVITLKILSRKCVSYLNLCAQRRQDSSSVRFPRHFPLKDKIREAERKVREYLVHFTVIWKLGGTLNRKAFQINLCTFWLPCTSSLWNNHITVYIPCTQCCTQVNVCFDGLQQDFKTNSHPELCSFSQTALAERNMKISSQKCFWFTC